MADWANLPRDLCTSILENLNVMNDIASFRVVCKSWQQARVNARLPPQNPWLLLSNIKYSPHNRDEEFIDKELCVLYNPWTRKTLKLKLPEVFERKCLTLSFGWLLVVDLDAEAKLLHPFSRTQIRLPPVYEFPFGAISYYNCYPREKSSFIDVFKAAVSCNPWKQCEGSVNQVSQDCIVMIVGGINNGLSFTRPGDITWHTVESPANHDIVYYKGKFYAVRSCGMVISYDLSDYPNAKSTKIITSIQTERLHRCQKYLVESSGDLLLVLHFRDHQRLNRGGVGRPILTPEYYTMDFEVHKLQACADEKGDEETEGGKYQWVLVKSLSDRALFLGHNSSFSLPASDCNNGVKANCIYFTVDTIDWFGTSLEGKNIGVFNIETGNMETRYEVLPFSRNRDPLWYI